MSDTTKKQFINDYFDLKEAFLKDPMSMADPETKDVAQRYMIKLNAEAEELGYR